MRSCTCPDTIRSTVFGRPSNTLSTFSAGTPRARRYFAVPSVAMMRKPSSWNRRVIGNTVPLSWSFTVTTDRALHRERVPGAVLRLGEGHAEDRSMPITSPVDLISGPRMVSTPGNLHEGEDRFLDRDVTAARSSSRAAELVERLADHDGRGELASGTPVAFETNGTVRDARGFTSST